MEGKWIKDKDTCPRCGKNTEILIVKKDGDICEEAERCTSCRWIADFTADEIKVKRY